MNINDIRNTQKSTRKKYNQKNRIEITEKEIITIANEIILQGYELSSLANKSKLIDSEFRLRRLETIIIALETLKEEWRKNLWE